MGSKRVVENKIMEKQIPYDLLGVNEVISYCRNERIRIKNNVRRGCAGILLAVGGILLYGGSLSYGKNDSVATTGIISAERQEIRKKQRLISIIGVGLGIAGVLAVKAYESSRLKKLDEEELERLNEEVKIEEIALRNDRCEKSPNGRHEYVVGSPIDTVEDCRYCRKSQPCEPFVDMGDKPLREDQK
jgi:hypothetical protein